MKIHLLSGFLGSGKTTAIRQASKILLQKGMRVGVITNDQGIKLVDADFFKGLNIPGRQVTNGCFCCNYNELDKNIESLIETTNPDAIFAESVGSCTDVVATVMKPLLLYRKNIEVTVSIFADARLLYLLLQGNKPLFDEDVRYIYFKQLEEAGIIVISKVDCMSREELLGLTFLMQERYPLKKLLFQNSLDDGHIQQWLDTLDDSSSNDSLSSLAINYDIYGAGEAKLAWLDEEIVIYQSDHAAVNDALALVHAIHDKIKAGNYPIGHLKFLLDGKSKISFTATYQGFDSIGSEDDGGQPGYSSLLINARVETKPSTLSAIVDEAMEEIKQSRECRMVVNSVSSFKPGFPRPTHRVV